MILQILTIAFIGLCKLGGIADAQVLTDTTKNVAENTAAGVITTLATTGTDAVTLVSQTNDGQFTVAFASGVAVTLVAGYTLDRETDATLTLEVAISTGGGTAVTATSVLTITDAANEYSSTQLFLCLSGTSFAAAASLGTVTSTGTGTPAYSIQSQPITGLLTYDGTTGEIKVAAGKAIKTGLIKTYPIGIRSTTASVNQDASLVILFGCTSASGAATIVGSVSLLLAMLVAMLQ